jgi:membrane-bound lytic murein transglycosylase D
VEVNRQETFSWAVKTEEDVKTEEEPAPVTLKTVGSDPVEMVKIDNPEASSKAVDSVQKLQTNRTTPTLEDTAAEVVSLTANKQHVVKAGETLYGIARQYNLAVMEIVEWNDLSLQQGIKPGQVLKLSESEDIIARASGAKEENPPLRESVVHEVKTSDTLYSISRQYNVTIQQIMEWNEKKDFSLRVGEKLKILRSR